MGDDLTLECQLRSDLIHRSEFHPRTVREPADAQRRVALADVAQNGVETEGAIGVEVGYKVNAVCGAVAPRVGGGGTGGGTGDGARDGDGWRVRGAATGGEGAY